TNYFWTQVARVSGSFLITTGFPDRGLLGVVEAALCRHAVFWRDGPAATSEREQNSRVDAHNGLLRKFSHNLCEELPHFFRIAQTEARLGGSLAPDADRDPVRERPKSRFIGGIVAYVDGQRRLWKLRHEGEDSGAL